MNNKKFLVIGIFLIILFSAVFYFFIYNKIGSSNFIIKNWYTKSEDFSTVLFIEFESKIKKGDISLYNPTGSLIDKVEFSSEKSKISFLISETKSLKPQIGNYTIKVLQNDNIIFEDSLFLKEANVRIEDFSVEWRYNELGDYYSITSLNLSFVNSGDIYGFIWEGKLIVDNTSNWFAPNKHWHDLDIWISPNDKIYVELPLELTHFKKGDHSFNILFTDKNIREVTEFYTILSTNEI